MVQLVNVYRQTLPPLRFIGKRYTDSDRVGGSFGSQWEQWFKEGHFATIEENTPAATGFEDANAPLGLMRHKDGDDFQYWIGLFRAADSPVPDGFEHIDFDASDIGIVWVQGPENELFMNEMKAHDHMLKAGYEIRTALDSATWFFERYADDRFTPQEEGSLPILDIGLFIKANN